MLIINIIISIMSQNEECIIKKMFIIMHNFCNVQVHHFMTYRILVTNVAIKISSVRTGDTAITISQSTSPRCSLCLCDIMLRLVKPGL